MQLVGPAAALLEPVVASAEGAEVARCGAAGGPGPRVVGVAAACRSRAAPHPAGAVAGLDEVGDGSRWPVGGRHGLDHGAGAGVEQGAADLERDDLEQRLDGVGVDEADARDLAPGQRRGDREVRPQPAPAHGDRAFARDAGPAGVTGAPVVAGGRRSRVEQRVCRGAGGVGVGAGEHGDAEGDRGRDGDVGQQQVHKRIRAGLVGGQGGVLAGVVVAEGADRGPGRGRPVGGELGPPRGGAVGAGGDLHRAVTAALALRGGHLVGGDAGGHPAGDRGDPRRVEVGEPVDEHRLHRRTAARSSPSQTETTF